MTDSEAAVMKVCGHMGAVLSESDSSSNESSQDESSQDRVEVEFGEELADSPRSFNDVMDMPPPVEMNEIMIAGVPLKPNGNHVCSALETKAPTNITNEKAAKRQPADNAFGIAYKPCGAPSKQGYELPAGPAFVDEDEFEQDMGAEFRVVLVSSGRSFEAPVNPGTAQSENVSSKTGGVNVDEFSDDEEESDFQAKEQEKASGSSKTFRPNSDGVDTVICIAYTTYLKVIL